MFKLLRRGNKGLKSIFSERVLIAGVGKYSNGSGKSKESDEDVKNELDDKIKPMERPCGNPHGTGVLSDKQRAHEKEYFYKEEREQIKALKKKMKDEGSSQPEKKKNKK